MGKTCTKFNTMELAHKAEARNRRNAGEKSTKAPNQSRKVKTLNLLTYKFHALGDYVPTIRMFGTTDSFSTQLVCAMPYAYASQVHQSPNSPLGRNCTSHCETFLWSNQQAQCNKADRSTILSNGGCPAHTEESAQVELQVPMVIPHPT